MNTSVTTILGLIFLLVACANTVLMGKLWGYPFDHATKKSEAPRSWMLVHRATGYVYLAIYLVIMTEMVPRLFHYQVELPARTVAHIVLGITIGFILVIKISILRWFRHFEEAMPALGLTLLLCTVLLISLSVPFSFKEQLLSSRVAGGDVFSPENRARMAKLLPNAGFPAEAPLADLATEKALRAGRQVLLRQCVECHDMKTILTRPRVPSDWVKTVERMAEKPVLGEAIDEKQQWAVTSYLIAISPELMESAKKRRAQQEIAAHFKAADEGAATGEQAKQAAHATLTPGACKPTYEKLCAQCHQLSDVDKSPPRDIAAARALIGRMVDNGLQASPEDIEAVQFYLTATYVKG